MHRIACSMFATAWWSTYHPPKPAHPCSDEMYRWLELDSAARLPAAADAYEQGISLTGCSKATGGPGLRIGWVATRDAAREAAAAVHCVAPHAFLVLQ